MTRIEALLARTAERAARRVSLDEALLTERALAYVWYRNRFLLLRIPLGLALHAAEVVAFSQAFELGIIGPMLAIRSLPAVAGALWWGALEELRASVRAAAARGDFGRAERAVRSFLGLGVDVALFGVALAVAYTQFWPSEFEGFDIFDAYALACSLRFGLELLSRTYHAGIFAVRRVYRPLWSLLLPDLVEAALAFALWGVLGPWGFSISLLVGGAFGAGLQAYYVAQAYREDGRFRPRWRAVGGARGDIEGRDFPALFRHALANLATHLDALAILLLSGVAGAGGLPFVVLLHALRPLLAAVSSYARVFYFDFTRLSLGSLAFFERRFARVVTRFGWWLAALVSLLAVAVDVLVFRGRSASQLLLLVAYTFGRSLLSIEQLRAFTLGSYRALARGALGTLAVLLVLRWALPQELPLVSALVMAFFVLALWLRHLNGKLLRAKPAAVAERATELVGVLRWLTLLGREAGRVRLGAAELDSRLAAPAYAVAAALQVEFPGAVMARVGRRGLVWYERAQARDRARAHDAAAACSRALAASAGSLAKLRLSDEFETGGRALRPALALSPFSGGQRGALTHTTVHSSLEQLRIRFASEFPDGHTLELNSTSRARFSLSRKHARATVHAITGICLGKPAGERDRSLPRAAVYCPEGEPEVAFLAPASSDGSRFRAFAREVQDASLAATLKRVE